MSKPTPGPCKIETHLPDRVRLVAGNGICIAVFRDLPYENGRAEAEANARAWVEGREAVATIEKIRIILKSCGADMMNPHVAVVAIGRLLSEPATGGKASP